MAKPGVPKYSASTLPLIQLVGLHFTLFHLDSWISMEMYLLAHVKMKNKSNNEVNRWNESIFHQFSYSSVSPLSAVKKKKNKEKSLHHEQEHMEAGWQLSSANLCYDTINIAQKSIWTRVSPHILEWGLYLCRTCVHIQNSHEMLGSVSKTHMRISGPPWKLKWKF